MSRVWNAALVGSATGKLQFPLEQPNCDRPCDKLRGRLCIRAGEIMQDIKHRRHSSTMDWITTLEVTGSDKHSLHSQGDIARIDTP
jgi:hypothetical protein